MSPSLKLLIALCGTATLSGTATALEVSGNIGAEYRAFMHAPSIQGQHGNNASLSLKAEFVHEWDDGRQVFAFVPFARIDQGDAERTHADIRELTWSRAANAWELRLGIRKVFWGVAESQHLVDIINQTDLVENLDGEAKLGQPMVNLALIRDWGTVDLFVLPYFRERTFPGADGRFRPAIHVDTDNAVYESGAGRRHVDLAVRWSHSLGDYDFGLSHFYGTSREPTLVPGLDKRGRTVLVPHYEIIHQTGIDVQATKGSWLWKLEVMRRSGQAQRYVAVVGGFEYTFYGISDSAADLGVLLEYSRDSRGTRASTPFQDDLFVGVRLALNDIQSSELLAGASIDRKTHARFYNIEASRRLGERWKLSAEARIFSRAPPADAMYGVRNDDVVQLLLTRYF